MTMAPTTAGRRKTPLVVMASGLALFAAAMILAYGVVVVNGGGIFGPHIGAHPSAEKQAPDLCATKPDYLNNEKRLRYNNFGAPVSADNLKSVAAIKGQLRRDRCGNPLIVATHEAHYGLEPFVNVNSRIKKLASDHTAWKQAIDRLQTFELNLTMTVRNSGKAEAYWSLYQKRPKAEVYVDASVTNTSPVLVVTTESGAKREFNTNCRWQPRGSLARGVRVPVIKPASG